MLPNLGSYLLDLSSNARMIGILHGAIMVYFGKSAMIFPSDQT
jgi:hypothetical protein